MSDKQFAINGGAKAAAGFSAMEITPEKPCYLAGYLGRNQLSTGVHDPLYVRCGLLRDGKGRSLALMSIDLLFLPRDFSEKFYRAAEEKFGIRREMIVFNAIHTHCAPLTAQPPHDPERTVDPAYLEMLMAKSLACLAAAQADLGAAEFRFGRTEIHFGVNRRLKTERGILMCANPNGLYFSDVPVLEIRKNGRRAGVFYSMNCHPTSHGGLVIGADYPGAVKAHFDGFLCFMQGAAGSAKPRFLKPDGFNFAQATDEMVDAEGKRIAGELEKFLASDQMKAFEPDFRAKVVQTALTLDREKVPQQEYFRQLDSDFGHDATIIHLIEHIQAQIDAKSYALESPIEVGFVRLSHEIGFLTISSEISAEAAQIMLDAVRIWHDDLFLLGYTGFVSGYIATAAMLREGGYEADLSHFVYDMALPLAPSVDQELAAAAQAAYLPQNQEE